MLLMNLGDFSPLCTQSTEFISKGKAAADNSIMVGSHRFPANLCCLSGACPTPIIDHSSYVPLIQTSSEKSFLSPNLQLYVQANQSLSMHSKSGTVEFARKMFDRRTNVPADLISWNSMIAEEYQCGFLEEAISMFLEMRTYGIEPDPFTFSVVIRSVEQLRELHLGSQLHCLAIKTGYAKEDLVICALIQAYASCGKTDDAVHALLENCDKLTPTTWNSIIAWLVDHESHADSFDIFQKMLLAGAKPTPLTFSSLLKACADTESLPMGEQIIGQVIVRGFLPNTILESALIVLYIKCGELEIARHIFDKMEQRNAITWNSIIRGYTQIGDSEQALKLFALMRKEGIVPDKFTFPALLAGASSARFLRGEIKSIHAHSIKVGLDRDCFVGSSLIAMYSMNDCIDDARLAFDSINRKDIAVWSSIISASIKAGKEEEALESFIEMLKLNFKPNQFIYSSSLAACGELSILEAGKQVHAHSLKSNDAMDTATKNSLINMYSNCGCIEEAMRVFNSLENPNLISFNSMISAFAHHGYPKQAAELFKVLQLIGLEPDEITILNLLSAFNHAGLVDEGLELFSAMAGGGGEIKAGFQHYACIVDMLCRAGEIDEAMRVIHEMPFKADSSLWRIVLGACIKHQNLLVGKQVAELLLELEPFEATNYVLLANIYARTGRWAQAEMVRQMMKDKGIEKEVGFSWIEIDKATHRFGVEDRSHPLTEKIYKRLHELIEEIRAAGYVPDISFTLHDVDDVRREQSLYYHSEKLAFAFGDLIAAQGVKLRIMKNLRVCGDCHSAYKHFSLITNREIVLRDKYRFHHFANGSCSCDDYW